MNLLSTTFLLLLPVAGVLILSYLLGSLNFSIILTKNFLHDDIRKYGSGNAGATNVLRSVGKKAAALTFALDFLKCVVAVVSGRLILSWACTMLGTSQEIAQLGGYIAGFACIIGHMFPLYFGFRGGKGVVSSAALIALVDWRVFLLMLAVFLLVFSAKKIVSLASIIGTGIYPVATFLITYFLDYTGSPLAVHGSASLFYLLTATGISAMVGAIVVIKHKENIKRLLNGTEKPITFKKSAQ